MSKRINVNPDHYKTAGRERPGDGLRQHEQKEQLETARARYESRTRPAQATREAKKK